MKRIGAIEDEVLTRQGVSPLEQFLRDYIDIRGGLWAEIEPKVYDVLFSEADAPPSDAREGAAGLGRLTVDPDALPEHAGCQFVAFGTPLVDDMLEVAHQQAPCGRAWLTGFDLSGRDLGRHLPRSLALPTRGTIRVESVRPVEFVTIVYWFSGTFISDQQEQVHYQVAIDGCSGRQVRHVERLLDRSRMQEGELLALPAAPRIPNHEAYLLARQRVVRSLATDANAHRRELDQRIARHEKRLLAYYDDLRREIDEQKGRTSARSDSPERAEQRRVALQREQERRLLELRAKGVLRVRVRLMNLLEVFQPKLAVETQVVVPPPAEPRRHNRQPPPPQTAAVSLVWDPLTESLEPPDCPICRRPTFAIRISTPHRQTWSCPDCQGRG